MSGSVALHWEKFQALADTLGHVDATLDALAALENAGQQPGIPYFPESAVKNLEVNF